jgi:hypothetical protein
MPETKGSILRFSIAYALSNVRLAKYKPKLTEEQRYEIAEETIRELTKFGGWTDLQDEVVPAFPRNGWVNGKPVEGKQDAGSRRSEADETSQPN